MTALFIALNNMQTQQLANMDIPADCTACGWALGAVIAFQVFVIVYCAYLTWQSYREMKQFEKDMGP